MPGGGKQQQQGAAAPPVLKAKQPKPGAPGSPELAMAQGMGTYQPAQVSFATPVGGVAPPFGAGGGPSATNTAQNNPEVSSWLDKIGREFGGAKRGGADPYLEESIGNLRARQSADTTDRAVQRTTGKINDQAAGQKAALMAGLGRRVGGDQAGLATKLGGKVDAAAQRLAAGATADIMLGRERDLDSLAIAGHNILSAPSSLELARTGQAQNLLGMGIGGANTLAQIGLADRGLNLQQWQAMMGDERARAEMAEAAAARREGQALALKQMDLQAAASGMVPAGGGGTVATRRPGFAGLGGAAAARSAAPTRTAGRGLFG